MIFIHRRDLAAASKAFLFALFGFGCTSPQINTFNVAGCFGRHLPQLITEQNVIHFVLYFIYSWHHPFFVCCLFLPLFYWRGLFLLKVTYGVHFQVHALILGVDSLRSLMFKKHINITIY